MGGTAAAAMSKFTRALKEYESVEESIDALLGATPQNDDEAIKLLERARKTVADMEGLTESMAKFEATAKETDPDKQLYGEKMVQKVFALVARWNAKLEEANALVERLDAGAAPALARRAAEEEAALA